MDKFVDQFVNIEPGETELDYVNPEELKTKKKSTKKKATKSEFPIEPHHKTIKKK
jgi:hypothetical protein